jgi:hypothetical protein
MAEQKARAERAAQWVQAAGVAAATVTQYARFYSVVMQCSLLLLRAQTAMRARPPSATRRRLSAYMAADAAGIERDPTLR